MSKPTKGPVCLAKTQISLRSRSESSLCALSVAKDLMLFLSAQRRLRSDWADAQADLSLRLAQMSFYWFCHAAAHMF